MTLSSKPPDEKTSPQRTPKEREHFLNITRPSFFELGKLSQSRERHTCLFTVCLDRILFHENLEHGEKMPWAPVSKPAAKKHQAMDHLPKRKPPFAARCNTLGKVEKVQGGGVPRGDVFCLLSVSRLIRKHRPRERRKKENYDFVPRPPLFLHWANCRTGMISLFALSQPQSSPGNHPISLLFFQTKPLSNPNTRQFATQRYPHSCGNFRVLDS